MKRIAYVGDVHGKTTWIPKLSAVAMVDHTVFLGDYVDTFDKNNTPLMQADNLKHIIDIKLANPKDITLLIGNHDIQYFDPSNQNLRCSGYNEKAAYMYSDIFRNHQDLFDIAYWDGDRLATHAGVTSWWYDIWCHAIGQGKKQGPDHVEELIVNPLNKYFHEKNGKALELIALVGQKRGGMNNTGGPLWADKRELELFPLKGVNQVVGHTYVSNIYKHYNDDESMTYFCDTGLDEILVFQDIEFEEDYQEYPQILDDSTI